MELCFRGRKTVASLFLACSLFVFLVSVAPEAIVRAELSTREQIPEFFSDMPWLNVDTPLTRKSLEGKIVIVSFWNYACLDCIKQQVRLALWKKKYEDYPFTVVSIHTPQYDFERFPENVSAAVKKLGFPLPVCLDAEGLLWRAYNRPKLPSYLLIDGKNRIRARNSDTGEYTRDEAILQDLLREQGVEITEPVDTQTRRSSDATGKILFGTRDMTRYGNTVRPKTETPLDFKKPPALSPGFFYLNGQWMFAENKMIAFKKGSELIIPFRGARVFLTAGSPRNNELRAQIVIDGVAPEKKTLGRDVKLESGDAWIRIKDDGLYEVLKNLDGSEEHLLQIFFEDPDALVYAVDFD